MAKQKKLPATGALRQLKQQGADFVPRPYDYEDKGGTAVAARELGVDEHATIKTLVMRADGKQPLIVLMHGDREVSTKALARHLGAKSVAPVDPEAAFRLTGYKVGGISPFGTRQDLPIYAEETIFQLPLIYINGGARGLLVEMSPDELRRILAPQPVSVAI